MRITAVQRYTCSIILNNKVRSSYVFKTLNILLTHIVFVLLICGEIKFHVTYGFKLALQERRNVHMFFDQGQGIWVPLPLAWELQSDLVKNLLADIQVQIRHSTKSSVFSGEQMNLVM